MTRRIKPAPQPRYQQTYPDTLATTEELQAPGLRPGTREPDAIQEYAYKDRTGLCALFERAKAVSVAAPVELS